MFRYILLASLLVAATYGEGHAPADSRFESFKAFHGKSYASKVHEARAKAAFHKAAVRVAMHNKKFKQGKATYQMELNEFSDMEPSIFNKRNGYRKGNKTVSSRSIAPESIVKRQSPASFDWRDQNKVSPVKNQGQCGSCWAFSTTGSMESQQLIANQNLVTLSEEQIVDCDTNDGGCSGGEPERAYEYIQSNGGLDGDATYPYTAGNYQTASQCAYNPANAVSTISGYQMASADDDSVIQALTTYGPLSVCLDADQGLQQYSSGILSCPYPPNINHCVLLVGYASDYWIVKNSWGTNWGMDGYFQLARGQGDCAVTQQAAYPQLGSSNNPTGNSGTGS